MLLRKRCCHCAPPCTIAVYSFVTPDSSTITDWTEVTGDWAIVSNLLDPPANGVITWNPTDNPGDMIRLYAEIQFGGATGTARFIVDYIDSNNYHYAEVICTGSVNASVRLWKRTGGTNTALVAATTVTSFSWSISQPVNLCWEGDVIRVSVGSGNSPAVSLTTAHGGVAVGLATGSTGASMRFVGPVHLTRLRDDCADCLASVTCSSNCESNIAPRFLKIVVAGIAADACASCGNLNGTYIIPTGGGTGPFTPTCDGSGDPGTACSWSTGFTAIPLCNCMGATLWSVQLFESGGAYYLAVQQSHSRPAECSAQGAGARWLAALEGVTEPPDCFDVLDGVTLPVLCADPPTDPTMSCDYSASTVTVSLP